MIPLDVPTATEVEIDMQLGTPNFRLPTSEKICSLILLSLVHRTASHDGRGESLPSVSVRNLQQEVL